MHYYVFHLQQNIYDKHTNIKVIIDHREIYGEMELLENISNLNIKSVI